MRRRYCKNPDQARKEPGQRKCPLHNQNILKTAGYSITRLTEVGSTNEYAMRNLASFPDRHIIASEIQTAGQGRLDRKWISDVPGNISISIILKPECPAVSESPLANISQYLALCICRIIEGLGIRPSLKWPNDILIDGKKVGGILCRTSILGDRLAGFVLGAGINLNMTEEDLLRIDQPAISLNLLTGFPVDRDIFLDQLAEAFFKGYDQFMEQGFPSIIRPYQRRSPYLGSRITSRLPEGDVTGIALRFTGDGCLVIRTPEGREKTLNAGDILL